ncbi:MAG: hypothetical protein N2505_03455 [Endomicrobia bacterium]|nr:hypothetical protein [Endomicrobiia bacterium]
MTILFKQHKTETLNIPYASIIYGKKPKATKKVALGKILKKGGEKL